MCLPIPKFESLNVEFKAEWNEKKDGEGIKKSIVAFANTAGGDLYIGVADNGDVVGLTKVSEIEEKLASTIRDSISPSLMGYVTTERLNIKEKTVLKVHVDQGVQRPYTLNPRASTGVYIRLGNTSNPATLDDIARMVRESNPVAYEDRISVEQELTFDYCKDFCEKRGLTFEPKSNRTFDFWNNKFKAYTNLAYLCSDQGPLNTVIVEFRDNEKIQLLNSERITGSLFYHLDRIMEFINRTNLAWVEKPSGTSTTNPERIDHYYVQPRVVLEAVVNMLAHRDYTKMSANLIHITPQKIDLTSFGGLIEDLSVEDIVELMATECRNKKLAMLFNSLKLMESRGSGFRYIRSFYEGRSLSDLLNVSQTSFTISLPRVNAQFPVQNEDYQKILNFISSNKEASRKEIQDFLDVSQAKAISILKKMVDLQLLERIGGSRSVKYVVKSGR